MEETKGCLFLSYLLTLPVGILQQQTLGSHRVHRSVQGRSSQYEKGTGQTRLPDLYWNSSNPMFEISNTDHVIDVNTHKVGHAYDQINIFCPFYSAMERRKGGKEQHVIYSVSKEEYTDCRVKDSNPRTIAICDNPKKQRMYTISFRSFSPLPNMPEYLPGKDYFFISTATPEDLHNRDGGYCTHYNMKVTFKVAERRKFQTSEVKKAHFSDSLTASPAPPPAQWKESQVARVRDMYKEEGMSQVERVNEIYKKQDRRETYKLGFSSASTCNIAVMILTGVLVLTCDVLI